MRPAPARACRDAAFVIGAAGITSGRVLWLVRDVSKGLVWQRTIAVQLEVWSDAMTAPPSAPAGECRVSPSYRS